jgi:hypothetical protein
MLAQLMAGNGAVLGDELVRRMRREHEAAREADRAAANRRPTSEGQIAAEKAEGKKAQRERVAARTRAKQLGQLAGKEPVLWGRVESLVANKQPKSYDRAVELLADLRDLAARKDEIGFQRQIEALRAAPAGKRTFIARLDKAGL